jgi:hypothetical protein
MIEDYSKRFQVLYDGSFVGEFVLEEIKYPQHREPTVGNSSRVIGYSEGSEDSEEIRLSLRNYGKVDMPLCDGTKRTYTRFLEPGEEASCEGAYLSSEDIKTIMTDVGPYDPDDFGELEETTAEADDMLFVE